MKPGPDWIRKNEGRCRSCGAPILWWITPNGKRSPHDPDGTSHFATCPSASQHRKPKQTYGDPPDTNEGKELVDVLDDTFTRMSLRLGTKEYHPGRRWLNESVREVEAKARL